MTYGLKNEEGRAGLVWARKIFAVMSRGARGVAMSSLAPAEPSTIDPSHRRRMHFAVLQEIRRQIVSSNSPPRGAPRDAATRCGDSLGSGVLQPHRTWSYVLTGQEILEHFGMDTSRVPGLKAWIMYSPRCLTRHFYVRGPPEHQVEASPRSPSESSCSSGS